MPLTDFHPSGSILAVGSTLKIAPLPLNSRTPQSYTFTTAAAATSGATAIFVTASPVPTASFSMSAGTQLVFGAVTVTTTANEVFPAGVITNTAAATSGATTLQLSVPAAIAPYTLEVGTPLTFGAVVATVSATTIVNATATAVPVAAISGAIALNATAVPVVRVDCTALSAAITSGTASTAIAPLAEILGIQSISRPNKTNLISIRSMKSGLGNEQRPTMIDFSVSIQGWIHQQDSALTQVLEPAFFAGGEIYAELYSPRGRARRGTAVIGDLANDEKLDDVLKYSMTLAYQGVPVEVAA